MSIDGLMMNSIRKRIRNAFDSLLGGKQTPTSYLQALIHQATAENWSKCIEIEKKMSDEALIQQLSARESFIVHSILAEAYWYEKKLQESLKHSRAGISIFNQHETMILALSSLKKWTTMLLSRQAALLLLQEKLEDAKQLLIKAKTLVEELPTQVSLKLKILNNLAILHSKQGNVVKSVSLHQEALQLVRGIDKTYDNSMSADFIIALLNNLGLGHLLLGNVKEARQHLLEACQLLEERTETINENDPEETTCLASKMACLTSNISYCYLLENNFDEASKYLETSFDAARKSNDVFTKSQVFYHGIKHFTLKGEHDHALRLLRELEGLSFDENDEKIPKICSLLVALSKAATLARSPSFKDQAELLGLIDLILHQKNLDWLIRAEALESKIQILFKEILLLKNEEILSELKEDIITLTETAKRTESYLLLIHSFWFQALYELLHLNIERCLRLLSQAQLMAIEKHLTFLATNVTKIINLILDYQHYLQQETSSRTSFQDKLKRLEIIKDVYFGHEIGFRNVLYHYNGETEGYKPLHFMILDQNGEPLLSFRFQDQITLKDEYISKMSSAIKILGEEAFNEAGHITYFRLETFTILLRRVGLSIFILVFEGTPYWAAKRVNELVTIIQSQYPKLSKLLSRQPDLSEKIQAMIKDILMN